MRLLRTGKPQLWRLARDYGAELPPRMETWMVGGGESNRYDLHWPGGVATLELREGRPLLTIVDATGRLPVLLSLEELRERGMIRQVEDDRSLWGLFAGIKNARAAAATTVQAEESKDSYMKAQLLYHGF